MAATLTVTQFPLWWNGPLKMNTWIFTKKLMNKKCCTSSIAQGVYLNGELSRKNTTHDLKGGRMLQ